MIQTLKKYWQIFWHFRRLYLMTDLEYRGNLLFWTVVSIFWTIFNFFFMNVIATANDGIGSWSPLEIQLLISVYTMMDACVWSIFYNNMVRYSERVFNGELNYLLTKPIDTQFVLMAERAELSNIPRFMIGAVMLYLTVQQLGIVLTPAILITFFCVFLCALVLIYFSWFIVNTSSFYVEKLININDVFPTVRRFFETPAEIYTRLPLILMSLTLPFALVTNVPVNVLRNSTNIQTLFGFVATTVIIVSVSRTFFVLSVKRYSGVAN